MGLKVIILAAGKGTRMKSDLPKVVHKVAGKAIINRVIDAVSLPDVDDIFVVVGHQAEQVKKTVEHPNVKFVLQEQQLGTGHAVMQVVPHLNAASIDQVLILPGDCPLIQKENIQNLLDIHKKTNAAGTLLSATFDDPGSYGRILRDDKGSVLGIKEAKDCSNDELKINEINAAIYLFQLDLLIDSLNKITTNNAQNEYYLTDVIKILKDDHHSISGYCVDDSDVVMGINTREELELANQKIKTRNNS